MAAAGAGAADGMFKGISCIYGCDTEIDRRPYHRNCGCALHRSRKARKSNCPHGLPKAKTVSYPMRKSWSEGCLALAAASSSSSSCSSSPSSAHSSPSTSTSPAVGSGKGNGDRHRRLSSLDEVEEEEHCSGGGGFGGVFFKV